MVLERAFAHVFGSSFTPVVELLMGEDLRMDFKGPLGLTATGETEG